MTWDFLFRVRQHVKGSLWLFPVVGGIAGIAAGALIADANPTFWPFGEWTYSASTADAVLAAIVGATVGLTGFVVTVSVLIVQMATGTFSARYMRLFYRDGVFKAALAALVGTLTFSYGLLRRVESTSVPNAGVTLAGFSLAVGVLLFLFFLDRSIHRLRPVAVAQFVARVAHSTFEDALRAAGRGDAPQYLPARYESETPPSFVVRSNRAGAIQAIDGRGLVRIARAHECLVVLPRAAGDFVAEGSVLVEVYGSGSLDAGDERLLRSSVALGAERTIEQDPAFAIRIMVDIAIRALSPAVNDPTTAVQVLDHLGDTLRLIGATPGPPAHAAQAPVIVRSRSWEDVVALGFTEIRQYGGSSVQVMRRLRATLEELRDGVPPQRRPAVERELERLDATLAERWGESSDLELASVSDGQGIGGAGSADAYSPATSRRRNTR